MVIAIELRVNLFVRNNPFLRDLTVLSRVIFAFVQSLLRHNSAEYTVVLVLEGPSSA